MAANTSYGDAALWLAAAAGEHAAFGQLFDRHATAVYNTFTGALLTGRPPRTSPLRCSCRPGAAAVRW